MNEEENEDSEGEDNDGTGEGGLVMTMLRMIGRITFKSCTWSRKGTVIFSAIVV